MKVLMISLFSDMPHHVSTEMEILQQHIDDGDDVAVLGCMGELPACMHKKRDEPKRCRECVTTRARAMLLLSKPPATYALDAYYTAADRAKESSIQTRFDSVEDVKDYFFEGFDLGYGALSSTVYICRDSYLASQAEPGYAGPHVHRSVSNVLFGTRVPASAQRIRSRLLVQRPLCHLPRCVPSLSASGSRHSDSRTRQQQRQVHGL